MSEFGETVIQRIRDLRAQSERQHQEFQEWKERLKAEQEAYIEKVKRLRERFGQ